MKLVCKRQIDFEDNYSCSHKKMNSETVQAKFVALIGLENIKSSKESLWLLRCKATKHFCYR